MAYDYDRLTRAAPLANNQTLFVYVTPDSLATVGTAGYFNGAAAKVSDGDLIMVSGAEVTETYTVTSNDGSTVVISSGLASGDVTVGSVSPSGATAIPASTAFAPFQVIWLLELACSAAGSATVTLSGVRRDDATTETVATYSLAADETLVDANDRTDHVSFFWTKTGTGAVTARVL